MTIDFLFNLAAAYGWNRTASTARRGRRPLRAGRLAVLAALAVAVVSYDRPAFGQIIPTVDRVENDLVTSFGPSITATFGYINSAGSRITLPERGFQGLNFFLPNSDNSNEFRGQPVFFDPGTFENVFSVAGTVKESLRWQIQNGVIAEAKASDGITFVRSFGGAGSGLYTHTSASDPMPSPWLEVEDGGVLRMQSGTIEVKTLTADADGTIDITGGVIEVADGLSIKTGGFLKMSGGLLDAQDFMVIEEGGVLQTRGGEFFVQNTFTIREGGRWTALGDPFEGNTYHVGETLVNAGQTDFIDVTITGGVLNEAGSATNIIGEVRFTDRVSGPGAFFGNGTATFLAGYAPGASPAVVEHENSVAFGSNSTLEIELAGIALGEFDRLEILQDLDLDGLLEVTLIDGFVLGLNQEFEILEVAGTNTGQFLGLDEGALVGSLGGIDLFISYTAGDGNDVALFTIPEPTSLLLLGLSGLMLARRRS